MSEIAGAILPVGLVAWKRRGARNFTRYWHRELLEPPYRLFCEASIPERAALVDRRMSAHGIPEDRICATCTRNMDREAARRLGDHPPGAA